MSDQSLSAGSTLNPMIGPSISATGGGTVDEVTYTVANTSTASVCAAGSGPCAVGAPPYTDTPGFAVNLTGHAVDTTTLTVTGVMIDEGGIACTPDTATITVTNPGGWWQVREGDIVTNGRITSNIPASCVAPCDPVLISYDSIAIPPAYPGIPSTGPSETINTGSGTVSAPLPPYGWEANESPYSSAQTYDYAFFESKVSPEVKSGWFEIPVPTITQAMLDLVAAGALGSEIDGYYWYYYDGALLGGVLTLDGNLDLTGTNRKVVLLVENADLQINGTILVQKGQSSVLAIVDGNILVDPSVGGGVGPHLEGLYITDGSFNTGTDGLGTDVQLHVRGSVAAPQGTINFQRNLADNSTTPGEIFEYGADQAIFFHQDLSPVRTVWREVAP